MVLFFKTGTESKKYIKQLQLFMEKTNTVKNTHLLLEALILLTERLVTTSTDKYLFFLDLFLKKWVRESKGTGPGSIVTDRIFERIHSIEWDRESIDWLFV